MVVDSFTQNHSLVAKDMDNELTVLTIALLFEAAFVTRYLKAITTITSIFGHVMA